MAWESNNLKGKLQQLWNMTKICWDTNNVGDFKKSQVACTL